MTQVFLTRRTFAIISHPDAGKTTLTEKLLLYGGAINMAGMVKAKKGGKSAASDWMKVEQERGISVTSSVMTFEYGGLTFNLLDTPGHADFSEDTYRTLTAVDSAIMVLDAAKGIEAQTLKLFEVCRMRDVPIITFINKMDRDCQDPISLLDEIEQKLALSVTPITWPIGLGKNFKGVYDILSGKITLLQKVDHATMAIKALETNQLDDPEILNYISVLDLEQLKSELAMVSALCPTFDPIAYTEGHLSPVYFGSALNNFGISDLITGLSAYAPAPRASKTQSRKVEPSEDKVSGFVFKIQANMDPKHRDRIAFMRLCSGEFSKGMKLKHVRSGKTLTIHSPTLFLAQEREMAEKAYAGDIIGIPGHGQLHIGDVLSEGEDLAFRGIPSFAPELFQRVRVNDPMKSKHLQESLTQLGEEGVGCMVHKTLVNEWIIGVVGQLQFEILADRLRTEYKLDVRFEPATIYAARWLNADDPNELEKATRVLVQDLGYDHQKIPIFLARNAWHLNKSIEDFPKIQFLKTRE